MFVGNTAQDIMLELSQWSVEGEIDSDAEIDEDGIFYQEAESEIKSALIQGGFPVEPSTSTPIARQYIAAMHRKLTALLYLQAHRLNLLSDGSDQTRGQWGACRRKLDSIARGEPFGELKNRKSSSYSSFCGDAITGPSCYRSL